MKFRLNTLSAMCTGGLIAGLAAFQVNAQAPTPTTDMTQMQRDLSNLREQARTLEQRMQAAAAGTAQPGARVDTKPQPQLAMGMGGKGRMDDEMGMPMAPTAPVSAMPPPASGAMGEMEDDMGKPMTPMAPASTMPPPAAAGMAGMEDDMGKPMTPPPMAPPAARGMGMGMDMMKMMEMMQPMMSGKAMSGTNAMGGVNSATAMATPSALPGFPGQSHLYHIGATGFFLDHPEHISLTTAQQQMLAQHKQQALLKQTEQQGQIDAAEQALWQLTGADQPQIAEIEKKTREIERLRGDQRVAYIRAVGGAAQVLTDEQRKQLVGLAPAQPMAAPAAMAMPEEPGDM
jgi:Spy/CpxP family protein refolding chaperone